MKQCSKCREWKPETEFYRDKRTKDGLKCQCKKCHCKTTISTRDKDKHRKSNMMFMRRLSENEPERARKYWRGKKETAPEKLRARTALNSAVRSGKIVRPDSCQDCGAVGMVYAHHPDYSKPLSVEWLCSECHGKRHRRSA